jgi:predicted nuclease of predicted toxin-antitoxin system
MTDDIVELPSGCVSAPCRFTDHIARRPGYVIDECCTPELARALRAAGRDAVAARDAGLAGAARGRLLAWTADRGQVLVTQDRRLAGALVVAGRTGPSVLVLRDVTSTGDAIDRMLGNLLQIEASLAEGAIAVVGRAGVRVRMLVGQRGSVTRARK